MITITQAVNELVARRPFLAESLTDGIINCTSLARQIKPEIEKLLKKEVKEGALTMALKRYSATTDMKSYYKVVKLMKNINDIIVRSNLLDFTFANSDSLLESHVKLLDVVSKQRDAFYTFVQGVFESNLILSNSFEKEVLQIFKKEKLISKNSDLSSITMKLPDENVNIPGLYYFILQKVAWEGINIIEVISTTHEFTLIVKHNDIDRAFIIMKNLK